MEEYKLNQKLAKQIIDSEYSETFETIVKESQVSPTTVAAFLTETLKALKREGIQTEKISENQIREIFKKLSSGEITKETIQEIISWLSKHEDKTVQEAIQSLGLKMLSKEELEKIIDATIEANENLIKEQKEKAHGIILGIIMRKVRGKANAATVSKLLKKRLENTEKS
jgi:glutamyl-tRNA(Gln) amidotransferase subunit E